MLLIFFVTIKDYQLRLGIKVDLESVTNCKRALTMSPYACLHVLRYPSLGSRTSEFLDKTENPIQIELIRFFFLKKKKTCLVH